MPLPLCEYIYSDEQLHFTKLDAGLSNKVKFTKMRFNMVVLVAK